MVVATLPSRSGALSVRLSSMAPRILERVLGHALELMIHAVEGVRDSRIHGR